jgi:mono/diheme cytochrome c family protein
MTLRLLLICCMAAALSACTSKEQAARDAKHAPSPADAAIAQPEVHGKPVSNVELTTPLNSEWVSAGKSIYETKCLACHRLTADRLVGPGWAGVTKRREPVWIMNMITNVEMMLATDEEAQKQLELCLVRMPNQNVTEADARKILEFMRQNDGEK